MKAIVSLAAGIAAIAASPAQAGPAVQAPIDRMAAAFNKGDVAAAKKTHVAAPSILDAEVPPFAWRGAGAFDRWVADLVKTEKAQGRTDGQVALGAPIAEDVHNNAAYVVRPSTYTFHQNGRVMRETGTMTFVLQKTGADWKIQAWTWTSPPAAPVN